MMVIANDTVKVLHVLSACLFLGNVVVSGTWAFLAERTRNFEVISFSNRLVLITDLMFTLTGALLVVGVPPLVGASGFPARVLALLL
jgi:uncharacterized membrane protein